MKHMRQGFTIIEVTLVMAISGLMFLGVTIGASVNISRQRYNDAVQDYADFLRRSYSETINVENTRTGTEATGYYCTFAAQVSGGTAFSTNSYPGRSECAIYGRLLTFGENSDASTIHIYDILGDVVDHTSNITANDTLQALNAVHAGVLALKANSSGSNVCTLSTAGNTTTYNPQWSAAIETTAANSQPFAGAVMIVRSPLSGAVHTFAMTYASASSGIKITEVLGNEYNCNNPSAALADARGAKAVISDYFTEVSPVTHQRQERYFSAQQVDFCVNDPSLLTLGMPRRDVRLTADGRNATAVELIAQDSDPAEGGNQCL